MICFTDANGNDISLDYRGTVYARHNQQVIAQCAEQPNNWDDWEVCIHEVQDSNAHLLQYHLAALWTANHVATRFLPRGLLF